jgi:hypothetical protein
MSGLEGIVSIVNASPTSLTDRQIPAMQNHGSPVFVKSHLSLRLFFLSAGVHELVKAVGGDEAAARGEFTAL